jgi:RHS repeat-associated protein
VTVNGAATDYLYDGPNLIAEYSGSTLVRRFVHGAGIDQPLVWFEGAATTAPKFLHTDERGSIVAVSDGTGAASSSVKYSPEGQSGTLASPFGYTGQLYIAALDLYYYKARMYSARIGRFLQPDPSRYAGGMNLYSYANGDPVNFGDPWGLRGCVTLIALDDNGREVADPIGGCDSIDPFPTYTPAPLLPGPLWAPPSLNLNSSFASAPSFLVTPTDTCPGSGSITSVPKGRFDPRLPLVRNNTVPADAISVTGPDGRSFNAPPYADFAAAYAYGRSIGANNPFGMNSFAVQVALGHGGMYDFQRDGQVFTPAYTFASNYAVGVVMNGAGYSLEATFRIAGGFARSNSSNAGDPAQASAWTNGWNAAASGACRR